MRTLLAFAVLLLLAATAPAAGEPVQDKAGLFKAEAIEAVRVALTPFEDRLHVEVRLATVKAVPAVAADRRLAELTTLAQQAAANPPARNNNDVLQFVACPEWKQVAVYAGPDSFAQKITPSLRDAMRQHFVKLFAEPDKELPAAIDAVCRDLVKLYNPEELTILDHARLFSPAAIDKAAEELRLF